MRSFVTFVFFCSSLICTELDRPWDAVSGRQLNVRLIFGERIRCQGADKVPGTIPIKMRRNCCISVPDTLSARMVIRPAN